MMGRKIKKNKNMRKSESDIRRLVRGSSSGSNSPASALSRHEDTSDHEILIDKKDLKQVRVVNLKDRDLSEGEEVDASKLVEEVAKVKRSKQTLDISEAKEPDHRHDQSPPRKSKEGTKELELEEDRKNANVAKRHGHDEESRDAISPPPPIRKGRRSPTPDCHEPEPHHPRYLNQAYWEPKRGASASHLRSLPHEMQRRLSSPFLQSPSGLKLSAQNRFKLHFNNSAHNQPRRTSIGKETNTAQRVASAKRLTILDLKSKIKMLQDEIEKLKKENRFLNHLHHRQDTALKKWEGKDAELPRLLNQHKDEIRALQQQLRKSQQLNRECSEKLTMRDKKIFRLEAELDKLRCLANEEHLQDRHQLQEDLDITRMNLAGAEKRIREYMKHVDILEKNHRHQLATQDKKLIKVNNNTYELQQVVANLRLALRNKDRMLNYIQMRSSGRNLIRAFHQEKVGFDDMLYGTCIPSDINRPYQPLDSSQLLKMQKAESITSGNKSECFRYREPSYGSAAPMHELETASQFSNSRRTIDSNVQRGCNEVIDCKTLQKQRDQEDVESTKRPLSKHSRSLDSMIRVATLSPRSVQEFKKQEKPSASNFPRGGGPPLPPSKVESQKREMKPNMSTQSQQSTSIKNQKVAGIVKMNLPQQQSSTEDVDSKSNKSQISQRQRGPLSNASQVMQNTRPVDNDEEDKARAAPLKIKYNETVKGHSKKVKCKKSKELVYHASVPGFQYDGPFKKGEKLVKQQSAEILYNAIKDEKISQESLMSSGSSGSSTYSSQSPTASSRSEMLSNIDIISARIRESCVLVPPPEEKLNSPRSLNDPRSARQDTQSVSSNVYFDPDANNANMHQVGSNGDGFVTAQTLDSLMKQGSILSISPRDNYQNMESSYYQSQSPGVLQLIATDSGHQTMSGGPNQTFLCTSPREQMQTVSMPAASHFLQVNDSSGNSQIVSPRSQSPHVVQSRQQLQESNMVSYSSPRISAHNYPSFNNVSYITGQQSNYPEGQQSQQSIPARFPYYPYAAAAQELQQSTNVTILQPNPMYDQQHHSNSTHSDFPQQNAFYSQASPGPKPTTLPPIPPIGYFNQVSNGQGGGGDSTLPSINNNSSATQSSYNPNYYVNLGSWK